MGRRLRTGAVAALLAAAVAGAAAPAGDAGPQSTILFTPGDTGGMLFSSSSDSGSPSIELDFVPANPALPDSFTIDVPRGYTIDLGAKRGDEVGEASVLIVAVGSASFANADGSLIAQDPAVGCRAGRHAAVWSLATSLAGQALKVTVDVDETQQPDVAYVLHGCTTALSGNTTALGSITLAVDGLVEPTAPGDYRWRAIVAPSARPPYELQAVLPLPESLTLHARYDGAHKRAVLTGKVVEGGKPVAGASVLVVGRRNDHATGFHDGRTNAQGIFTIRAHTTATTDFSASVGADTEPCPVASTAPGGCLASTTIPPDDRSTSLWLSVPTGARRAIRAADQRAAERIGLAASDLADGFESDFAGANDCLNPKGEPGVTITGESGSPLFYDYSLEPPRLEEVSGLTRVYANTGDARAALAHEGTLKVVRCVVARVDAGDHSKIKPFRLPHVAAAARGFRTVFSDKDITVKYDVVFLQRGRSMTTLQIALLNAPSDFESKLVARLAARMR